MREKKQKEFFTSSGIPVKDVYTLQDFRRLGIDPAGERPGRYPFTRGIHPGMYRDKLWTIRQYAGFGTAEESNARYRYLLSQGQTGLSVAFDLPTQVGVDSDDPLARGEVGRVGVAIDSLRDMETLFKGIPLDRVSVSMTINAPAAILLAMYLALAEKKGLPWTSLSGTIQNDILKEYIARGTYIFPPRPSLKLTTDVIAFCQDRVPKWNTMSISGYHIREAGSTAVQELAFTFANADIYVATALASGMDIDAFAPRLSFFLAASSDFFEEAAKFRAARRIWARMMREKYRAKDPQSWKFRFHTQTSGSSLTAQEPENNVIRVALQALSAVLGGTQSLHTNSRDEALSLPAEDSVRLALRTQQIIAQESGVASTVDPLGGSYYVEVLTEEIERRVEEYFRKIHAWGGMLQAIESGFIQREIQESAYRYQKLIEGKERAIVGLNVYAEEKRRLSIQPFLPPSRFEKDQIKRLQNFRTTRPPDKWKRSLEDVTVAAREGKNLMPFLIEAVKAGATLGEITTALKKIFGTYQENPSL